MWADMGYEGKDLKDHIKEKYQIDLEIIKRPRRYVWVHKDMPEELLPKLEAGFKLQPRRWVVERTFSWRKVEAVDYQKSMIFYLKPHKILSILQ